MTNDRLEPTTPEEGLDLYLQDKRTELADATLQAHQYRLNHFLRWCNQEEIDDLNELSGRDFHRYKLWRQDDGDLDKVSLKGQIDTLRVFVRWCESIDAVRPDLSEQVVSPSLEANENQRDAM